MDIRLRLRYMNATKPDTRVYGGHDWTLGGRTWKREREVAMRRYSGHERRGPRQRDWWLLALGLLGAGMLLIMAADGAAELMRRWLAR